MNSSVNAYSTPSPRLVAEGTQVKTVLASLRDRLMNLTAKASHIISEHQDFNRSMFGETVPENVTGEAKPSAMGVRGLEEELDLLEMQMARITELTINLRKIA